MADRPDTPATAVVRDIVLVVDDTPDTLAMLTDALDRSGYTVLIATGGAAALSVCDRITPDVILMDAVMPGLDGFATCRQLKSTPTVAHIPVIFMTALSETEHIVQGLAAGGVDYVTKPIVLDELFARIRVHLVNARAAQSARLALDTAGNFLLAVDHTGALLWSTPQASRILMAAGPHSEGPAALPETARADVLAAIAGGAGSRPVHLRSRSNPDGHLQLTYLGAGGGDEFLFRLAQRDHEGDALRRRFALTAREAEVLLWIARGKPNRDIADILELSPRTVNKHLEVIFRKLGVENRASAAVLASRILGAG